MVTSGSDWVIYAFIDLSAPTKCDEYMFSKAIWLDDKNRATTSETG